MNKTHSIPVRVTEAEKEAFKKACKTNYTTPSAVLYKLIKQYTRQSDGNAKLITNLRNK